MRREWSRHLGFAKWIGTATALAGAVLIALNIGVVADFQSTT